MLDAGAAWLCVAIGRKRRHIGPACEHGECAPRASQIFLIREATTRDAFLAHRARFCNSARVGISIWNVEPFPIVESTQMRPPCISTICLAMASPRPVPPLALVSELST